MIDLSKPIPDNHVAAIRQRVRLAPVVGEHTLLTFNADKTMITGKCPLPNCGSPAFKVAAERDVFHCDGCGRCGDVILFVQLVTGTSWSQAALSLYGAAEIIVKDQALEIPAGPAIPAPAGLFAWFKNDHGQITGRESVIAFDSDGEPLIVGEHTLVRARTLPGFDRIGQAPATPWDN